MTSFGSLLTVLHSLMSGSGASAIVDAKAPCGDCAACPPTRVPTRGSDFHNAHAALRGTFQNAVLQSVQHSLLRELRQDCQVFKWYVKLGPVVANHALTVMSRREKTGVRIFEKRRSYPCGHREHTLTCFEMSENVTPEGSYHR